MPAERGGATGRDRAQRPVLDRGESMRAPIRLAMGAHDVGEFQPGDAERPPCRGARRTRVSLCGGGANRSEQIERRAGAHLRVPGQLKVARGRTDVPVPEQALNRVDVDAGLEQVRREGMPQGVNPPGLGDPRALLGRLIGPLQRGRVHRVRALRRRKQPRRGARLCPVPAQGLEQARREHRVAILAALALLDANGHPRRIDVGDAQVQDLGEPQARRVGRQDHRAMFRIRRTCAISRSTSARLKIAGSVPGRRGEGTLKVMRSRFSVV